MSFRYWVQPLYLKLLHANFLDLEGAARTAFVSTLRCRAQEAEMGVLEELLDGGWRERLTAAWLGAVRRDRELFQLIGQRLMGGSVYFEDEGYAAYFACMGGPDGVRILRESLDGRSDRPEPDGSCADEGWAMAAVAWLEKPGAEQSAAAPEPDLSI
jgi:hypothetical protein